MAQYQWASDPLIIFGPEGFIPAVAGNRDYDALVASGEAIAPYVPPAPTVPASVKMWQARAVLGTMGLDKQIDARLGAMPGPEGFAARAAWEYAADVGRESPLVVALAKALGLTEAQLDQLFVSASSLKV